MPYAISQGERIHYHVEGDGPPLVLQHGRYGSMEDWYEYRYVTELKHRFRLVLIDARAHGNSGKPYDSEKYSPELHAGDVVAVLDETKVARCHYLGFSLGGRIGYWLARFCPQRLLSLIVLGMDPYPRDLNRVNQLRQAAETIDVWGSTVPNISEKHKSRLLGNDKRALVAAAAKPWPDDSHVLHTLSIPCLIACGDRDAGFEDVKRSAGESKRATFVQLSSFDHVDALVRSDVIIPHITGFMSSAEG